MIKIPNEYSQKKIMTCEARNLVIKNIEKAIEDCIYVWRWGGDCTTCPSKKSHDFKELPDLIKKGYKTV